MEFKHLQSFVAVVNDKSFTKAAEKLYISQPTISIHIHALEDELCTQLIVRTTKVSKSHRADMSYTNLRNMF